MVPLAQVLLALFGISLALLIPSSSRALAWSTTTTTITANAVSRTRSTTSASAASVTAATSTTTRLYSTNMDPEVEDLLTKHDPILLFASRLLPADVALDAAALYAWCRRLDEITDDESCTIQAIQASLVDWEARFDQLWNGHPVDAMDAALTDCLQRNSKIFTRDPFVDMIAGMKADAVAERRIATMDDLEEYGYQVAGTVGLMLLPLLINSSSNENNDNDMAKAREPAIALGTAIQLINILRDATPDAALGRIYLPQDLLRQQGVLEDDVLALRLQPSSSDGYCEVVRLVSNRAAELLLQAERGKDTLPGLGPLFVQVIIELYRGYLEQLETMEYNNLSATPGERVKISTPRKLAASAKAVAKVLFGN
jgi:phytoene synthase